MEILRLEATLKNSYNSYKKELWANRLFSIMGSLESKGMSGKQVLLRDADWWQSDTRSLQQ